MSQSVVIGGQTFVIPDVGERSWGQNVTDMLGGIASQLASAGVGGISLQTITTTPVSVVSGKTYLVDTSTAKTLNLPAPSANAFFTVRDVTGKAFLYPITIHRSGGESIDGVAADKTLNLPNGSWLFACDGTNWYSIRDSDRYTLGLIDGWIDVPGLTPTVTDAGQNGTIKFAGKDLTSYFQRGTRLKLTQSGITRYFFVKGSAFSTDTEVYILSPSANSLTGAEIAAGSVYVSQSESPEGFPTQFDWTPTITGFSSTTTNIMNFWISGKMIIIGFEFDGTSNSGNFSVSAGPVTWPSWSGIWCGAAATAVDNGVYIGTAHFFADPSSRRIKFYPGPDQTTGWTAANRKMIRGTLAGVYEG